MTEALTANLAQIGALRVISRATVMQYKGTKKPLPEIAQQLKTDVIVLGSVFRSGSAACVLRPSWCRRRPTGTSGPRPMYATSAISWTCKMKLHEPSPTKFKPKSRHTSRCDWRAWRMVNADAYEAYLKGRFFVNQFTEEALEKSKDYFQEAIQLDSGYGAAYAGLAEAWALLQAHWRSHAR